MFSKKQDSTKNQTSENHVLTISPTDKKDASLNKLSQKEIVYERVVQVIKENKLTVKSNQPILELLNPDLYNSLIKNVCDDFLTGKASLKDTPANKDKISDLSQLKIYVRGLCNNWLRRDPRLNGTEIFKQN